MQNCVAPSSGWWSRSRRTRREPRRVSARQGAGKRRVFMTLVFRGAAPLHRHQTFRHPRSSLSCRGGPPCARPRRRDRLTAQVPHSGALLQFRNQTGLRGCYDMGDVLTRTKPHPGLAGLFPGIRSLHGPLFRGDW
jgi:hypothetical protein